jgi:hypothetical protein
VFGRIEPNVVDRLKHVRERVVPYVVKERRHEHRSEVLLEETVSHMSMAQEGVEISRRGPIHTETVLKARVGGAGIDPRRGSELANSTETLKVGVVDHARHTTCDSHVIELRQTDDRLPRSDGG